MSDEELDELVRRSAEAYPEEVPLGNWLRMEDKLQKAATEKLVQQRLWRFFVLEVVVVALLLLLWQGYRAVSPTAEAVQHTGAVAAGTILQPQPAVASARPHVASPRPGVLGTTAPVIERLASSHPSTPAQKPTSTFPKPASKSLAPPLPLLVKPQPALPHTAAVALAVKRPAAIAVTSNPEHATPNSTLQSTESARAKAGQASITYTSAPTQAAAWMPIAFQTPDLQQHFKLPVVLPLAASDTLLHVPSASVALTDSTADQKDTPTAPFYRVVVGVVGAPAWSAVRTLQTAQLGGNLGLTLEYRLSSRIRVRSGLVRSVKRYEAASSDYTPQPAWNWRPGTYEVYANCRITEIPLDLRYDIVSKPTHTLFATAGLTSLLMRHERYAYDYQVNGQTRTAAARVVNGSNYAFGLFTASAGLERPFSSRWSGQIEPFVQLPLGSVGAGKVRLSSAGVSLSVKYGLLR